MPSSEYANSSVGSSPCTYNTLGKYNTKNGMGPAVAQGTVVGRQIVPQYGAIGYKTLLHGGDTPGCSGYFNIQNAYGSGSDNCSTSYVSRICQ
jgi:hypothetical protein